MPPNKALDPDCLSHDAAFGSRLRLAFGCYLGSPLMLVMKNEKLLGFNGGSGVRSSLVIAESRFVRPIQQLNYCACLAADQKELVGHVRPPDATQSAGKVAGDRRMAAVKKPAEHVGRIADAGQSELRLDRAARE